MFLDIEGELDHELLNFCSFEAKFRGKPSVLGWLQKDFDTEESDKILSKMYATVNLWNCRHEICIDSADSVKMPWTANSPKTDNDLRFESL